MKNFFLGIASLAMTLSMFVFMQATALAQSTLVCDRGLPTLNLNNVAGANRSNVSWSFGPDWITGDDCTIGVVGETYVITKVRGWNTQGAPGGFELGDRFKSISLYLGRPTEALTPVATGTLAKESSTNSNPSITHTRVTYSNGENYQGTSVAFIQIWQNDFNNLVYVVSGGAKIYFSGDGILQDGVIYNWFNHASNAALSGSAQEDADNFFLGWDRTDLSTAWPWDSSPSCGDSNECGGWDKSSDINVQLWAEKLGDGMATGGGWFIPEFANNVGLDLDGSKATFGFIARNKKSVASGNLEFQYHSPSSGINLNSTNYDSAQIGTSQAIFEGTGTVNGTGSYKFRVRAVDGDKLGGGISDRFEIRIWTTGGSFDVPFYRAEGDLGGGQIVVHKK